QMRHKVGLDGLVPGGHCAWIFPRMIQSVILSRITSFSARDQFGTTSRFGLDPVFVACMTPIHFTRLAFGIPNVAVSLSALMGVYFVVAVRSAPVVTIGVRFFQIRTVSSLNGVSRSSKTIFCRLCHSDATGPP